MAFADAEHTAVLAVSEIIAGRDHTLIRSQRVVRCAIHVITHAVNYC
jgi:hypothetical protein